MTEPPLETGWLPDTPVDDTLLQRFLHSQADHNSLVASAHSGRVERTDDVFLADANAPVPYYNEAILRRPVLDTDDPVLDVIDTFYESGGSGPRAATVLSIWPTPDLSTRGWQLVGHPAIVVRAPAAQHHDPAPGVEIRRVSNAADLEVAEQVVIEGYPLDEARGLPAGSALPPALLSSELVVRLGILDGVPVAAGNVLVAHGLVNLALGATLPAARRRGVWEALVWARVAEAPDLPAVAYTSDFSRPGFIRMGFLPITRFTLWTRHS